MLVAPLKKSPFRVLSAGPWDHGTFNLVDVEIVKGQEGLEVHVSDRITQMAVEFTVPGYTWEKDQLIPQTGYTRKWVFQALS